MSTLISRNITLADRRTSIRLEPEMWDALNEICARERRSLHDVCTGIDRERQQSGLTAAVRVFILNYFREAATEEGHARLLERRDASAPGSSASENSASGTSAPEV